jgi:hypothetical protein
MAFGAVTYKTINESLLGTQIRMADTKCQGLRCDVAGVKVCLLSL